MSSFKIESGKAAPLLAANIDTDVIMPKQFLKRIDRNELDKGVFFDQRFLESGEPNPEFILNRPEWQGSRFLVVGPNFGCGSSREYAVWGMKQLGIRGLIGTSFAGIFDDNCQRNGILNIKLNESDFQDLGLTVSNPVSNEIEVDLPGQLIRFDGDRVIEFNIDPLSKASLIEGLDAIASTLQRQSMIDAFEQRHLEANPWLS